MRQFFFIFLAFILLIVILVGLNAASYVHKDKTPDSEYKPNRSTFNTGATGTRAFYDLLAETGRKVVRWQESTSGLFSGTKNNSSTFVVIGQLWCKFDDKEIEQLLRWISFGGKLVVADREPPTELITTTANWSIFVTPEIEPSLFGIDPLDQQQMTEEISAAKPSQPTTFTKGINSVQPSRFASSVNFEYFFESDDLNGQFDTDISPPELPESIEDVAKDENTDEPAPSSPKVKASALNAPVIHLANSEKTLLVEFPFGSGRIVYLTDPYIISNGGINLVDNGQLGINIVSGAGIIAFDEYHQGYGAGENRLFGYFADTPLTAIVLQLAALIGFILFTQSRRFARALPEPEPNRLSKLEYVSAMAELQRRTKAFDLALGNIYTEFRRQAARVLSVNNLTISRTDLAQLISERANLKNNKIENLMFKCEDIIRGEPTNKKEVLQIISRLREIEEKLGLKRQRTTRK